MCNRYLCDFEAMQQSNLKKHKEDVHESVKYMCNMCDY